MASRECGGDLPELDYLLAGDANLVLVALLARESAVDVGVAASSTRGETWRRLTSPAAVGARR